jgi:hypothetical protein
VEHKGSGDRFSAGEKIKVDISVSGFIPSRHVSHMYLPHRILSLPVINKSFI